MSARIGGIDQVCKCISYRNQLPQNFETFSGKLFVEQAHAGNIPSRAAEARHKSDANCVASSRKDDWNGCCRSLGSERGWRASCSKQNSNLQGYKFCSQQWQPLIMAIRPSILKRHVFFRNVT